MYFFDTRYSLYLELDKKLSFVNPTVMFCVPKIAKTIYCSISS